MPSAYDLSRDDLVELLVGGGVKPFRAKQVWSGLHERLARPEELTDLAKPLRAKLEVALPAALHPEVERVSDDGRTTKWLWRLEGGATVETVLMR